MSCWLAKSWISAFVSPEPLIGAAQVTGYPPYPFIESSTTVGGQLTTCLLFVRETLYVPQLAAVWMYFPQELRSQLLAGATGRVLEVGVGTGLNLRHYRRDLVSAIEAVDLSPGMLSQV